MIHEDFSKDSQPGFAIVYTPEGEKVELERVASIQRERKKTEDAYARKYELRRLQQAAATRKEAKKRLAQLDGNSEGAAPRPRKKKATVGE
jgi:hypothetical protein